MPTRRSPSPAPPGAVLPHPQALIPAGVSHSQGPHSPPLQGSLHPLGSRSPPPPRSVLPGRNLRPPQNKPSAQSPFSLPQLPLRLRSRLPEPPRIPPPTTNRLRSPLSDPGNRTSHLQPKMVAPAHVPSRDHRTGASVPNPPLPPPGSFSTATPGCPTHSHPHWASSTPVTTAPRPTGPFARPSPREDVSNPNEATFPRSAPSTHLKRCSLAPAPRPGGRGPHIIG
ncbi:extensin-like [Cervus elaphus]|uniref:extensin-like n=1 Tax=Cervus elaphus TaxID=9860 RepID=UPI001CC2A130|nr:extensin-like [Cervus elaphus]